MKAILYCIGAFILFISFLLLIFYPNGFKDEKELQLTDLSLIDDTYLRNQLELLKIDKSSHMKALKLIEKYPQSIQLLYKLFQITEYMEDYEEALSILTKIQQLALQNKINTRNIERMEKTIKNVKRRALEEEKNYPKSIINQIPFKIGKYKILEYKEFKIFQKINLTLVDLKLDDIKQKLDSIKIKQKSELDKKMLSIKRLWAIHTGQVEEIYHLSNETINLLTKNGILDKIIIKDGTDRILKKSEDAEKFGRSLEIKEIILDNIKAYEESENIANSSKNINLEIIKNLHLIFINTARYNRDIIREKYELIRRGKFKIYPNYVITDNDEVLIFTYPKFVNIQFEKMVNEVVKLEKEKVNPILIAAFVHANFILIHPFDDGNGRVARALVSIILFRCGLLPFNVEPDAKDTYIEALDLLLSEENPENFIQFIIKQQYFLLNTLN